MQQRSLTSWTPSQGGQVKPSLRHGTCCIRLTVRLLLLLAAESTGQHAPRNRVEIINAGTVHFDESRFSPT